EALLLSHDRPVQLVFAGKAHPADDVGKEMIRQIVLFSRRPSIRHRMVFVEDYDIAVARALYQGCDVWLNTPRRPLEACGTSGEKAAVNGALNCSILDGWWAEMFNPDNGWAISSAEGYDDLDRRDEVEATSLFDILEGQVVPLFYEQRDESGVPHRWARRVRSSMRSLGWRVEAVIGLGSRGADDVAVLLLHGPVGPTGELQSPSQSPMAFIALDDRPGCYRFEGTFTADRAGRYGLTVRVVPAHPDLATPT